MCPVAVDFTAEGEVATVAEWRGLPETIRVVLRGEATRLAFGLFRELGV